jgi:hypothetical protein
VELSGYKLAIIAGGFGVAGTLVGVLATYWLALKLADRQFQHAREIAKAESRHVASRSFIDAFAAELQFLETVATEETDTMEYLRVAYQRHAAAVATFEHYVLPERRSDFRATWQQHCYGHDTHGKPDSPQGVGIEHSSLLFLHYGIEYNLAERLAPLGIAAKSMRALLAYAEGS